MEVKKISPFDFVKSITETKEDIFEGNEQEYNAFVINKALSFNVDCVFLVHAMSKYPELSKEVQYKYLLNSIDKKKRYGRWVKKDTLPNELELIKTAYGYSDSKALAVLPLFNDKQLLELKSIMDKGGHK